MAKPPKKKVDSRYGEKTLSPELYGFMPLITVPCCERDYDGDGDCDRHPPLILSIEARRLVQRVFQYRLCWEALQKRIKAGEPHETELFRFKTAESDLLHYICVVDIRELQWLAR